MRRVLFGFALLLLLGGCTSASFVATLPPGRIAAAKTVGVISVIGDKLSFGTRGIFRFNNEDAAPDITSWQIDSFVVDQIKANLRPDIQVVTATYPPAALNVDDIHWTSDPAKAVSEKLSKQLGPNSPHVDLWLVVVKQEIPIGEPVYGLGATVTAAFGSSAFTVYSGGAIAVLDGTTLAPLAFPDLRLAKPEFMAQQFPAEVIDEPAPSEPWDQAPESWRQKVRAKLESQLTRTIAYTVSALGLGRRYPRFE